MQWLRWVRCASFGGFVGEIVALVFVVLAHFNLLPDWLMLEVAVALSIGLGVGIGTLVACVRHIGMMDAARITETSLGLKERLSSALEFERDARNSRDFVAPSILLQLQQQDAATHAGSIRARQAVPFRWPWQLTALIVMTVVLIVAIVVPNLPMFMSPQERTERAIVAKEGQQLEQQARVIDKVADAQQLPHTKWAAQQMKRLGQQMTHGRMDKRQAFVKYGQLTQEMRNVQRQLSQNGSMQGTKSLTDAGRQLAQSLQAQGNPNGQQNAGTPHSPQSGQGGSGANASGSGKAGSASKNQNGHGFNIPGFNHDKPGASGKNQSSTASRQPTNEMKQAAKAMQNGDTRGLSQQLRQLAQRVQSGQMSQDDRQQAQQDLQKLSDALQGTPMKETQQHAQAAADAMKQGDTQRAADEMRKAADAADRESKSQQDGNSMQNAQKSLQNSQNDMAGASSPSDVGQQQAGQSGQSGDTGDNSSDNGQGDSSGQDNGDQGNGQGGDKSAENEMNNHQGQGSGNGQGDRPGNGDSGQEGSGSGSGWRAGHGQPHTGKPRNGKWHKFQGPPNRLNPNFDPSKFPKYNKIYLGKPHGGNMAGRLGKTMKTRPGAGGPHPVNSQVPYYNYVGPAKQAAEHAVDHEDIPPSYQGSVRKYFDSLTPSQ